MYNLRTIARWVVLSLASFALLAFAEDEQPASGEVFAFLVVGVGPDGTRGLAGLDSHARQRDLRAKNCPGT
jgi:hypothetical protein